MSGGEITSAYDTQTERANSLPGSLGSYRTHRVPATSLTSSDTEVEEPPQKPQTRLFARIEHAALNLTPSFFSLNMGTGIASILLYDLPFNASWLRRIGVVIFIINVVLFFVIFAGNVFRFIRWKGLFTAILKHPLAGLYWGTFPMGFITIVNMVALACVPGGNSGWARLAVGLWWIDAIMSVFVNLGMVYLMITRQTHTPESMSAAWLLPIVTCVVAASSGGIVSSAIMSEMPGLARSILIASYVIFGTGVPLAMFVITIYLHQTIIHGVPAAAALPSAFLPVGPCGQGSFGIIVLGKAMRELAYGYGIGFGILPDNTADIATAALRREANIRMADAVYAGGLVTGLLLWGLGICWYLLAMTMQVDHWWNTNRLYFGRTSFNVGFTAFTFPIGVLASATTTLATELDSMAFKIIGTVLSLQVVLNWIYVMVMAISKVGDKSIFAAPELALFPDKMPPLRFGAPADVDVEKNSRGRE